MAYIALSPKSRATRINAGRSTIRDCWVMQWRYTQHVSDQVGTKQAVSMLSGFQTIVTRPGMSGLWLDSPYYCYSGLHRYRRLPRKLAARVILCCVNGWLDSRLSKAVRAIVAVRNNVIDTVKHYSPRAILQRRRDQQAWRDLFGG